MSNMWKALAFTLVGALVSITVTLYIKVAPSYKWLIPLSFLVGILILYGTGICKLLWNWALRRIRTGIKICLWKPRIGILRDISWEKRHQLYATYTNLSPKDWQDKIIHTADKNGVKVKVRLITTKKNLHGYMIVLNPYGGAYPERNLQTFTTLDKIFEYVAKGGLFVNIADVPGFYADSPKLDHRVAVGSAVVDWESKGVLLETPFMRNLGLRVYTEEHTDLVFVERFAGFSVPDLHGDRSVRVYLESYRILQPIVQPRTNTRITLSFFKKYGEYGDGRFLISMLPITDYPAMSDILAQIVIREVQRATLSAKDKKRKGAHLDS